MPDPRRGVAMRSYSCRSTPETGENQQRGNVMRNPRLAGGLTIAMVLLAPLPTAQAEKPEVASMIEMSSDQETLQSLNDDYIRSVQTSDVKRFREILADDFLCSLPDGSLVDRDQFLQQTAPPVTISNLQAHDVKVRLMGDFAIIHARTSYITADGRAASGRYTDVWARRNGRWLVVSAHVTRN